jgi:hypothetical protein
MARGLAVAVLALLLLAVAPPAQATEYVVTQCSDLQPKIDGSSAGDVITLTVSCTGSWTAKSFSMFAPIGSGAELTIQGSGAGITLTGNGTQRILTGDDVRRLLIQNITFRGGIASAAGADGGAIEITGYSGLQVFNSAFFANQANDRGGAIHVASETPPLGENSLGVSALGNVFGSSTVQLDGNTAATGGAISVETPGVNDQFSLNGNLFTNNEASSNGGAFDFELAPAGGANVSLNENQVIANRAGGSGGGGHLDGPIGFLNVTNSLYENNSVEPVTGFPATDHFGGGLFLGGGLPNLAHNTFKGNSVKAFPNGGNLGGGGLAVLGTGVNAQSEYSRIEGNTVAAPLANTQFESEGGGLFFSGDGGRWQGFLDAIAGNSVGAGGEGGGIYVGAPVGATSLELAEVTVAANSVGAGGQFAGIAGDPQDDLQLWNSIVYTGGAGDIGGFDSFDIQYSDACTTAGGVFGGPGNICADPKLVGGANVHQTVLSPTIDKGSDELFNMVGGERANEDYEGDLRPTDGDGDGHTVDMGADETPAGFIAQPPVIPPPPPQCSDQVDNDGDGAIDAADPGCLPGPTDNNEGDETARDLVLCGQRQISLVRADVRGSKVVLSGIVATSLAGQKVQLTVRYLGQTGKAQKLGSVTPGADGQFQARVKKPPKKLFNDARYQAKVGTAKSVELKLPQSLASSSLKQAAGATLELRGRVDRALLGKRNPVVIKRILCGKYTTVGQARPNKKGAYAVRFPSPPSQGSALYRAETKVLARPGSKRYVKQFARAIGITF